MVNFEYVNNENSYKKFVLFTTFIHNKKFLMPTVFCAIAFISLVLTCVGFFAWFVPMLFCLVVALGYCLITYFIVSNTVKKQLSKAKNFTKVKNEYSFDESGFTVKTTEGKKTTETTLNYADIVCIRQNKNFYYLYVNSQFAFIIDANKITLGSESEFKQILQGATDKKRCKIKV